ncbi:MAG: hypothetical protein ACTHXO_00595 [Actinomycetaceae bacterium]
MTAVDTRPGPVRPTRATLEYFGVVQLAFAGWVLLGATVVFSLVVLAVHLFGTPEQSFVQYGLQAQVWFTFGLTIWSVWAGMDTLVPAGATRRSVWVAVPSAGAVAGTLVGVVSTVTVWLEGLLYDRAGWAHVASADDAGSAPWADGWITLAIERGSVVVAAALAGTLVGAAFYRFRSGAVLVAILTLPLTALPLLVVGLFISEDSLTVGPIPDLTAWADGPVAVVALAVLAAYTVGLSWLLLRDVPVRMRTL